MKPKDAPMMPDELMKPLSPIESAELLTAASEVLTVNGANLLRRVLMENDTLRAERDKLETDNIELRKALSKERRAIKRLLGFENWPDIQGDFGDGVIKLLEEGFGLLRGQLANEVVRRNKLQAFKDWVHNWLDKAGVPHDPDQERNKITGCRVGGRLEWLMTKLKEAETERDLLTIITTPSPLTGWTLPNGANIKQCFDEDGIFWMCNRDGVRYSTALDAIRAALK